MANEEQLAILRQGVDVWNRWREENTNIAVDLSRADFTEAFLEKANFSDADLSRSTFTNANLRKANLSRADLRTAFLQNASLYRSDLRGAILHRADLNGANLERAFLIGAEFRSAHLVGCNFSLAVLDNTIFGNSDLSSAQGLVDITHTGPSSISTDAFALSKGNIPEVFLRGCGLSDVDVEYVKLSKPNLSNEEINKILYRIYDLRATQALQISPLFISYSHADKIFVDKLDNYLIKKGIRFWRDIHDMKAGRMEKQIDSAISQGRTVLLVLSESSLASDWVEHEVRSARLLEKDMGRDVLCPVALDDSWKSSRWPKRLMEQIMEYNILDFSEWKDDVKFEGMFRKLIDGLELFYKG